MDFLLVYKRYKDFITVINIYFNLFRFWVLTMAGLSLRLRLTNQKLNNLNQKRDKDHD